MNPQYNYLFTLQKATYSLYSVDFMPYFGFKMQFLPFIFIKYQQKKHCMQFFGLKIIILHKMAIA